MSGDSPITAEPPAAAARRLATEALSLVVYSIRRFSHDNCFQTAASLAYTTLLAIVPLMTIGFAIFSAFPAFAQLQKGVQEMVFRNMVPEIGDAILEYLDRFTANAGQTTIFGVIGLAISAVLLIWTIEGSFAAIWRVKEPRSAVTRILSFWAIVSLAPLFAGASLSLSSTVWQVVEGANLHGLTVPTAGFTLILPTLTQTVGCTLLYLIIPNRPVEWRDAALGGVIGALLLEASKVGFAWYLRAFPAYQTIYGALSTIPIFLFWLYIVWSAILYGAVVAAALPEWRADRQTRIGPEGLSPTQRLGLALAVLRELMDAARQGPGLRLRALAGRLPMGAILIEGALEELRDAHWVALTTGDAWVLTRDLQEATLMDLMMALGIGPRGSIRSLAGTDQPWRERAAALLETAEARQREVLDAPLKTVFEEDRGQTAP